jgi:50S ribosomal protein L16 3-hydroxylase
LKILTQLLGSTPLEEFLDKHFTRLPFSSTGGAKDFTHLLSWKRAENIVDAKKSVLRIVQDGKVIKDYVELNFKEVQEHHSSGHTLLVRYAEKSDELLQNLANDFAHSFHTEVDIQLYCTPDKHNAFGWHYDVEEVFIIQTQGSKSYTIRPNTVHPNPLIRSIHKDMGYEKEKTPIEINVTLEAGDWLYIPSGWWHIARTQKESMHISIGLMPKSAVDILDFIPDYLAHDPFWRTRMPLHKEFSSNAEEVLFYQEAMAKLGKNLGERLSSTEFITYLIQQMKNKN